MATPGDRIVEPSGVEVLFVETAGSSGGRRLEVEWTIPAGRRLVARAHRHPDGPLLAQRGQVDERFDIRPQLQSAVTIRELMMPGTYLAGPPTWLQDGLFALLAAIARRRGYEAYVEPEPAADPDARVPHLKEP